MDRSGEFQLAGSDGRRRDFRSPDDRPIPRATKDIFRQPIADPLRSRMPDELDELHRRGIHGLRTRTISAGPALAPPAFREGFPHRSPDRAGDSYFCGPPSSP